MSKKQRSHQSPQKEMKPHFIEIHWEKFILVLLLVLPLIYFASFLSPHRMIAGSDYLIGGYPFEKWTAEQEELPMWYPHVFGGIPVLGAPVGGPLAPLSQLKEIIPPHVVLALTFIILFFLAGLGMYLYLKKIGLSPYSAAVGAVIYQFIGNLATTPAAGHSGRAASIALFPLMLFLIHSGLSSKRLLYFVLMSLVTAFAFYEGHFQITYYALLFILGYVIYYFIIHRRELSAKDIVRIIVYGLVAVTLIFLLMAAVWLPVLGGLGTAARGVERGYEYTTSWSLPPLELIDLFIPTFSGLLENYWGFNAFKIHLEYFGIIALVLAFFTVIFWWKKRYVKYYVFIIIIVLLIALGSATPFFRIVYTIIPGFRLFRAPSLIFYLISFSVVVLAAIGFDNFVVKKHEDRDQKRLNKKFTVTAGIVLAVFIIVALIFTAGKNSITESMQDSLYPKLVNAVGSQAAKVKITNLRANFPNLIQGTWRSFIFIIIVCSILYLSIRKEIKPWIVAAVLIIVILVDLFPLVKKYVPEAPSPEAYYRADDVVTYLKRDTSIYRVFPLQYEHAKDLFLLYHDIESAGGYIPNPIQRYQDFIGAGTSVMFSPLNLIQYPKFIDMLNIKYVIAPNLPEDISQYDPQSQQYIMDMKNYLSRFERVATGRAYTIYLNTNVLPRAYIVGDYQIIEESKVLDYMKSPAFDPQKSIILEHDPEVPHPAGEVPFIKTHIIQYSANKVVCMTECMYAGFLVLADNWHPDWQVSVDGKKEKLYIANYTFRAVYVPAGKHAVIFAYVSPHFNSGRIITLVALFLSIAFCIVTSVRTRSLKKQKISVQSI
jgi:hypothetical protein